MKRKHLLLSMALAGACFQTGGLYAQYPDSRSYLRATSVARIGDGASSIGDSENSYRDTSADIRPTEFRSNSVDVSLPSDPLPPERQASYLSDHSAEAPATPTQSYSSGDCYEPSLSCYASGGAGSGWVDGGALLWWAGGRNAPPLVTRHPNAGGFPVLGAPTQVLAGGEQPIGDQMMPGYYVGFGKWLDCDQCIGVGGRAFGLFGGTQTRTFTFDGVQSLGVPFFNTSLGIPDAYLVGFNAGVLGSNTGSISVASDLDLFGAEAYLRKGVVKSGNTRIDAVGGYLFAKLDDSLILRTNYTDGITNAVANGTNFVTVDQFSGSNTFHGGQIGVLAETACGKWSFSSGTKFGLGNMHQVSRVSGLFTETPPTNVGTPVSERRGLLAQRSNSITQTRDAFAFIPQIDLKMGYQVRCNLRFDVGYSFMYFSNVVLGGNQIDSNIDIANILQIPTAPGPKFETDSLILHGLSLGGTYTF